MINIAQEVIVGTIMVAVVYTVYHLLRAKWDEDKFIPPMIERPKIVQDVFIGKYYGDVKANRCVTTVSYENGVVAYRYNDPRSSVSSLPVEEFIAKFTKFPNGCELDGTNP